MKRIQNDLRWTGGPVVIWLENIEDIIQSLREKNLVVTLSDGEYEYDDVNELVGNHASRVKILRILARGSDGRLQVTVLIDSFASVFSWASSSDTSLSAFAKVRSILECCVDRWSLRKWSIRIAIATCAVVLYFIAIYLVSFESNNSATRVAIGLFVASVIGWIAGGLDTRFQTSRVYLARKNLQKGFFEKYRDAIVGLFGAVIGAVASTLVTNIFAE